MTHMYNTQVGRCALYVHAQGAMRSSAFVRCLPVRMIARRAVKSCALHFETIRTSSALLVVALFCVLTPRILPMVSSPHFLFMSSTIVDQSTAYGGVHVRDDGVAFVRQLSQRSSTIPRTTCK